jgi:hypothetical protein
MRRAARSLAVAAIAAVACAASASASAPPTRYACYPAQFGSWRAQTRMLADKLSFARAATSVSIGAPETVCAPAPGGSSSYLTCYAAKSRTIPQTTYAVTDEFARSFSVTVQALGGVCLPSTRVDDGGSTSTPAKALLSCYTAKAAVPTRSGVAVGDVFGSSKDSLAGPLALCSPAGWKTPAPDGSFLTCYGDQTSTTGTVVILQNELGYLKAALGSRGSLCTAASVTGGGGLTAPYARAPR